MFHEIYTKLKKKGVVFPKNHDDSESPSSSDNDEDEESKDEVVDSLNDKFDDLLDDMNVLKGNINLANMMLDSCKPDELQKDDCPIRYLIQTFRQMEHKLCALISSINLTSSDSEEIMKACVLVMDDIALTVKRYQSIIE